MTDEQAMRRALDLALKGTGKVSPNPRVGAVIVHEGEIIGEGWHSAYGSAHAEVEAIRSASRPLEGATLYVNLEPCNHFGKTPPCTHLIIDKKFRRVVIGMTDPNPEVSGRGISELQQAGIEVNIGVLEEEAQWINRFFTKYITTGQPYILAKIAQSLDGCIATVYGQSKWITSEESRQVTHALRAEVDAVLVGAVTVAKDDPELTVRLVEGRNPKRVILDSDLSISLKSKVFAEEDRHNTFVFCTQSAMTKHKATALKISGVNVFAAGAGTGDYLSLRAVLEQLASKNVASVMVEGGARIFSSFAQENLIDELHIFTAPILIGSGLHSFSSLSVPSLQIAKKFTFKSITPCGTDMYAVAVRRPAS
ncbi:MAG: bifunctional diaminohydroxyphosphoribosylaminopyrimidine deaminase/5-amino-6-(5-phosphoribosylamino)uracil reductase RibD [Bacteroidota bacterium]|nr:bifunctional diaminohydroxyphosphoribosylaminopyrimidine deaminase/5-amino-6-(5-phosphoribosylamino)uracil reductase RibD [Candidatus Kapabacteria bacterium]MDW8219577.1 bifunctional diaminohydroxyphosphoribosylaminopyrimidine deaminase/5-amino-6-(5-phosphoribosylamino)uracil reductase RibD [Bacteroidota bacterium]